MAERNDELPASFDEREHAAFSERQEGNESPLGLRSRHSLPPVQHHPAWDDSDCPVVRHVKA